MELRKAKPEEKDRHPPGSRKMVLELKFESTRKQKQVTEGVAARATGKRLSASTNWIAQIGGRKKTR